MPSRNDGNSTIRTFTVTPFGYLQIGIMLGSGQCALYVQLVMIGLSQILQQLSPIEFTIEFIHLGNFNGQFLQITFRKATHYIKLLQVSFLLGLRKFQNHINGFLLGVTDETASIDYGNLSLRSFRIMCHMESHFLQLTHQMFRIHQVFRTS